MDSKRGRDRAGRGTIGRHGRVTEWFKEPVLKTGEGQLSEGSNPSPSANLMQESFGSCIKLME